MMAHLSFGLGAFLALAIVDSAHAADEKSLALETLPSFEARSDHSDIELATPFEICFVARYRKGTHVSWPLTLELGEGFEEVHRRIREESLGFNVISNELCVSLLLFDTKITEIPGIALSYDPGTGEELVEHTAALPIHVVQEPLSEASSLRGPAEPVEVLVRDWRQVIVFAGLFIGGVLLAAVWLFRRGRARRKLPMSHAPQVELAPHLEALAKLAALESSGALDADELKDCFLAMSEVFRTYLGRRYGFSAMDLTSTEIRLRLDGVPGSEAWLRTAAAWLSRCDLVKYANTAADPDEAREALYGARVLIDRTKEAAQDRTREVARA